MVTLLSSLVSCVRCTTRHDGSIFLCYDNLSFLDCFVPCNDGHRVSSLVGGTTKQSSETPFFAFSLHPPAPLKGGMVTLLPSLVSCVRCTTRHDGSFFYVKIICHFWIASYLAMTVIAYRHCEEERRSNPVKHHFLHFHYIPQIP